MEEGTAKFADPQKALLKLIGEKTGTPYCGEVNQKPETRMTNQIRMTE